MHRDPLATALLALTFVTGLVDAASFLGLGHIFTANMTGNIVLLGFAIAGAPMLSVPRSLTSLGAFLLGAAIGGRLGATLGTADRRRWLLTTGLAEAGLLVVAAFGAVGFDVESGRPPSHLDMTIVLTRVAMGLRNGPGRGLAGDDLTTTVLTLTLTGLAADFGGSGGEVPRLGRRVVAVLAMFAGAAIGTALLARGLALPLALSGVCVLAATVYATGSVTTGAERTS